MRGEEGYTHINREHQRGKSSHQSGRQDNHKLLFSLVMIEQWLRRVCLATKIQDPQSAGVTPCSKALR